MCRVYVSVGSNIDRERCLTEAVRRLRACYGKLTVSSVYESDPVGFQGNRFLNLVLGFDTDEEPAAVAERLRSIEALCGRVRTRERFCSRTLDLDLLLYGALVLEADGMQLPREEILTQAFVLRPLAEIAPTLRHPTRKRTYAQLWSELAPRGQATWVVDFDPAADPSEKRVQKGAG